MTAIGAAFEFLSGWFADHTMWAVLIVGVVVGTFVIIQQLDHDS